MLPELLGPMIEIPIGEHGAHILLPEDDHLTHELAEAPWYEHDLLQAIAERTRPGAVFVDVGAHFGNHTLFFLLECAAGVVVSVEPHPWTYGVLLENIGLAGADASRRTKPVNALVHPTWLSARCDFKEARPWMRSMLPSIMEGDNSLGDIPCLSLDDLMVLGADVVKIDAEEMGAQILESGLEGIRRQRPLIAIESEFAPEQLAVELLLVPEGYECIGQFCSTPTFLWEHRA